MTETRNKALSMVEANKNQDLLLNYIKKAISDEMLAMHVSSWILSRSGFENPGKHTKILKCLICIRYTEKTKTARIYFTNKVIGLKQTSFYKPGSHFQKSIFVKNPYFDYEFAKEM